MKLRIVGLSLFAVALLSTGCYNNPEVSARRPGEVDRKNFTSGPAVGPGTVAGGSTAGTQPAKHEAEHGSAESYAGSTETKSSEHAPEKH